MTVPKTAGELDPVALETSLIETWNNEKKLYCENDCGCMNNVGDFTKQTSETEDFVKNIEHKMSE